MWIRGVLGHKDNSTAGIYYNKYMPLKSREDRPEAFLDKYLALPESSGVEDKVETKAMVERKPNGLKKSLKKFFQL
ncbi:hypothetical protein L0B53_03905 [Vibrio sp. SS-MA-C1-2]|uniref:hypothetical protein n=1 Tax=Vibrio sp. SS-MA-C1-2 TaxID=2908646 RepID=UPI001F2DA243|nr:hypothetical protein [Vibrio sp. SS-MA-C1-2]UJF17079.1 hypothetical protein L0B53_03905 [Vibrio sp. SS-MA-C1-2]